MPEPITLSPGQSTFFSSRYKYTIATSGLGGGKTFVGCLKMMHQVASAPGSLNLVAAATYPLLRDSTYRTFMSLAPEGFVLNYNSNEGIMTVQAENGTADILWRSLVNYDFLRGTEFLYAYVDELALVRQSAWKVLKGRLRGKCPVKPELMPQAWGTTTPRGKNWMYQEFVEKPSRRHAWCHWPGTDNLVNLPDNYYEDLGYTGSFYDQEVLGEFRAFEGLVYAEFDDRANIAEPPENFSFNSVFGGLDFGFIDPTAAVVFGRWGDQRLWQLDEYYKSKANFETEIMPAIFDLTKKYGVAVWWCDSARPDLIDMLNRNRDTFGCDTVFRSAAKGPDSIMSGIQIVQSLIQQRGDGSRGLLVSPNCINTLKEYGVYQFDTKERLDRNANELPIDSNNHAMDASRYAIMHTIGKRSSSSIPAVVSSTAADQLERLLRHSDERSPYLPTEDELARDELMARRDEARSAQTAQLLGVLRRLGGV